MARNHTHVEAPPEAVWDVLADPPTYADWVVGSNDIRGFEGSWPEKTSLFHHTQGMWPLQIKDTTSVLEVERPRRMKLEVRARPLVVAHVELILEPAGRGTRVTMIEAPVRGLLGLIRNPLVDGMIHLRNVESLRRLRRLAERRAREAPSASPARAA